MCSKCSKRYIYCKKLCQACYQKEWRTINYKTYRVSKHIYNIGRRKDKSIPLKKVGRKTLRSKQERYFRYKYTAYCRSARYRNILFNLSLEQFIIVFVKPCFYCGNFNSNGVDRYNNKIGYITENIVPCCTFCNRAKNNWMAEFFIQQCLKIAEHFKGQLVPPTSSLVVGAEGVKVNTVAE